MYPSAEITWLIIGIIFLVFEMIMPGFIVFFFAIGAWTTALITFTMDISLNMQLLVFLLTSLFSLFALRKLIQKTFLGERQGEDSVEQALAAGGEQAVVLESIDPPREGKVSYSGTSWRALAEEKIDKGEVVIIQSQDGLVMTVKRSI